MQESPKNAPQALVWWILWLGILSSVLFIHFFVGPPVKASAPNVPFSQLGPIAWIPLASFFLAVAVRWLILPRIPEKEKALPVFMIGLALCEGCGILGIFIVPEMRSTYVILALLGILQFAPFLAAKFDK